MRVAVLACTRRVRCCEEVCRALVWTDRQRPRARRAGSRGSPRLPRPAAWDAGGLRLRSRVGRGRQTAVPPERARACGCGCGRRGPADPSAAWGRAAAGQSAIYGGTTCGAPCARGRADRVTKRGAASGRPPGRRTRRARAAETPGAAREARTRAVCQSTIGGAASGRQGPPGGRSRATLASTATAGVAGSEDPI